LHFGCWSATAAPGSLEYGLDEEDEEAGPGKDWVPRRRDPGLSQVCCVIVVAVEGLGAEEAGPRALSGLLRFVVAAIDSDRDDD